MFKSIMFIKSTSIFSILFIGITGLYSQYATTDDGAKTKLPSILIIQDPFSDSRTGPEKLVGPSLLYNQELLDVIKKNGAGIVESGIIEMPKKWQGQYGEWNRASLTNNVLNKTISNYDQGAVFIIGLLSGNKSVTGMLAGLQHLGPDRQPLKDSRGRDIMGLPRLGESKPLKVGLIWIHSEAAFNTPDITLQGDMGGMKVAEAAGLCTTDLRLKAGLDPPISSRHIIMAGVWDTNPYEQHLLDNSFVTQISIEGLSDRKGTLKTESDNLSMHVDLFYVHVDLSILERLSINDLTFALEKIFSDPKAAALGIASCPENPDDDLLKKANLIVHSAIQGIKNR